MDKFNLGDVVTWLSGAGSGWKRKTGPIVAVIPERGDPIMRIDRAMAMYGARSAYGGGMRRDHESYLVLVDNGGHRKPTIYWPRVSALTAEIGEKET